MASYTDKYEPITRYPCCHCENYKSKVRLLQKKLQEIDGILKEIESKPHKWYTWMLEDEK